MTHQLTQLFLCLLFCSFSSAYANNLTLAVASNFSHTMKQLAADFHDTSGHTIKMSSASTGKLYIQIKHGAPFDVFFGADETRADLLIEEGKARSEFSRVYALGKLTLVSNIAAADCRDILHPDKIKHLAIANPRTAPYGMAAREVLQKLALWDVLENKLVLGENISQTLQFVSIGNASAGFVAQSLLTDSLRAQFACSWDVPVEMYQPIKQKMVILTVAENKPAVKVFWHYMQSDHAQKIIRNSGYDIL